MKKNKIISIILSGLILTGCSSNTKDSKLEVTTTRTIESTKDVVTEPIISNDNIISTQETTQPKITTEQTTQKQIEESTNTFSDNDNIVIESFKELKIKISSVLTKENFNEFKETCKDAFITIVDFIFCDGEIKGVKFDDLTDAGKQEILSISNSIDNLIIKKFPNYREEISTNTFVAYNKAKELIEKGSKNIKDFSKEKLGEENYNNIKNIKDIIVDEIKNGWKDTKEDVSELTGKAKEKIKDWYNNFKNE